MATTAKGKRGSSGDRARMAKGQAVASPAELAEKAVAGRLHGGTCGEGIISSLGKATAANLQAANLRRQQGNSGHPFLLPLFLRVSSTPPGVSCRPHHLLPPPLHSGCLASPTAHPPSPDKIRDIKLTQQSTTSSSIASVGDAYEQSSASVCHAQKKKDSLAGRRVRILNFSREVVASGILIFDDNDNVVMGKKLGGEYYEVSILIAHDPTASLFIKDADRKNMNDAVGSHIIWLREYGNILAYGVRGRRDTCLRFKLP
ncbi:hypothetical protein Taro_043956 [Colocasia esculenta]|uniref:Uncharacterized protein n=1 Tax=Colocasia esculenta TaxID=4460 RepID=A0A843X1R0_COLES|nr:hypothetical protein [Colocasia esculenta]